MPCLVALRPAGYVGPFQSLASVFRNIHSATKYSSMLKQILLCVLIDTYAGIL